MKPLTWTGVNLGVRGRLAHLAHNREAAAAAFDSRSTGPAFLVSSTARAIVRRLKMLDLRVVAKPESFTVHGQQGLLLEGELDRAHTWAKQLADRAMV